MGIYSAVILALMVAGMAIAATSDPFRPGLFYAMLGGALAVVGWGAWSARRGRRR